MFEYNGTRTLVIMRNGFAHITQPTILLKRLSLCAVVGFAVIAQAKQTHQKTMPSQEVIKLCHSIESTVGDNVEAVTSRFGMPDRSSQKQDVSPHDKSYINQRVQLHYKDGVVSIYQVPNADKSFLEFAIFTPAFQIAATSNLIGISKKRLQEELGAPDKSNKDKVIYYCSIESYDLLAFTITNQHVSSIILSNHID
ncbi:hypothetical protein [Thalassotalea sp. Y01]|uniref:hypothetical protein n=1 Tax=Thalassotalea sp. Y01 TaxID=2729613 RepID=UPI00145D2F9E|nr:hypothetical protein [Thalassotalea sp. Y01]NMP16666.1 hypothetical protein [Thalassotalea sp. Y01]